MTTLVSRRSILLSIPVSFALAGGAAAGLFSRSMPRDLDLSLAKLSNGGLYRAVLSPAPMPVTVGKMHSWTVTLQTTVGAPLTQADIAIGGGMPQHGHGLPTAPQVTKNFGDGRYLIEGVKFNMRGWWTFEVTIDGVNGRDLVTFNLVL
jgi:hypothetical protein